MRTLVSQVMFLPTHIADRIRAWVAGTPKASGHADHESAKYGGISLMGTIGSTWLLRPDGTFWDVDDDFGKPPQPLAEELHTVALVEGAERHAWLAELIPRRPSAATDCKPCNGRGYVDAGRSVFCPTCSALGWIAAP